MIPLQPDPHVPAPPSRARGTEGRASLRAAVTADEAAGAKGPEMSEQAAGTASPRTTTFNILFVCTGNTCRSPLAEGIARAELERRGWKNVRVASAGLAVRGGDE